MSALDKLRRLRDRLVDFCGIRDRGYDGRREFSPLWVLDEIDRLLAEQTPEPGAFIWQCACGSRNVVSSAVCTKCGNGRPNSALPLTGPNYMDQEEWGHAPAPATDAEIEAAIDRCSSGEHVEESSAALRALIARRVAAAEKDRDQAMADLAAVTLTGDSVATDSSLYRGNSVRYWWDKCRAYADAFRKRDDAMERAGMAEKERNEARAEAQQELADLHAELDTVRDERNEARAELAKVLKREADGVALFDELLARERAEVAQLKEKLTRWDIDYDRVHKEAKDLRAEVERLRAAASPARRQGG